MAYKKRDTKIVWYLFKSLNETEILTQVQNNGTQNLTLVFLSAKKIFFVKHGA